ncbi:hypothetical protein DZK25_09630 [Wenzhouxiangella sp. 15181]|nr:hypothetical protein DZK25_09630 [Wenzhouxiangella sp. 15181]RFP69719.1 hypothetical protein DZK26_02805 [Wenzhouxiangella sp. 15190]
MLDALYDGFGIKKAPGEGGPGACSRIRFGDCNRILLVRLGREANHTMRMVNTETRASAQKFQKFA